MAVCNIFNELRKTTGTFLTFSQYVEDLTKEMSGTMSTKVSPSKFVAMNIDYSSIKDRGSYKFTNYSLPKYIRDRFENGCALGRGREDWNSSYSTNLFWNCLFDLEMLTPSMDGDGNLYSDQIKYVGDINIESYNVHDGMGYSELYCFIPSNVSEKRYNYIKHIGDNEEYKSNRSIEGYSESELGAGAYVGDHPLTYIPYVKVNGDNKDIYEFSWDDSKLKTVDVQGDSFNFNTIVILYDVYRGDDIVYKSVPMGIYFTGTLVGGVMGNSVTKFVSSDAIYNTGTSYGLKVCTRFISHPGTDELVVTELTTSNDDAYELGSVLAKMSETHNKMDEVLTNISKVAQPNKDLLSIFKNSRVNVPYLKEVNGVNCWFVNGRMLGAVTSTDGCCCSPYSNAQMHDFVNRVYALKVNVNSTTNKESNLINKFADSSVDVYINWSIDYKDAQTIPDKLEIGTCVEGGELTWMNLDKTSTGITLQGIDNNTSFTIKATKDGKEASDNTSVVFVYPSFFGLIPCTCEPAYTDKDDVTNHHFNPSINDVMNLSQYTYLKDQNQVYNYNNLDGKNHVCLAYPMEYNMLQSIVDQYGRNYIDDFNRYQMDINGIPYYVYVDRAPSFVTDYTLYFRFNEI